MIFRLLQNRIKGALLWEQYGLRRLYFPAYHTDKRVVVRSWFELVDGHMDVRVQISCPTGALTRAWCKKEARKIQAFCRKQYRELIHQCESSISEVHIFPSLKDNIPPVHSGSMNYQAEALEFLCRLKVGALFGDSGVGKTKTAVDLAYSRFLSGKINKVLVLCACARIHDFGLQIRKWQSQPGLSWKLTGIESMGRSDSRYYEALEYAGRGTMIIIDESHMVKSPAARRSLRIQQVCRESIYKLILSDIPVTENPANLYMQYAMLDRRITGYNSWEKFARQFVLFGGINMEEIIGYKNLDYLTSLIAPYTYQIKREDMPALPSKIFCSRICDLTEEQDFHYRQQKEALLKTINHDHLEPWMIVKYLTILQQIACGFHRIKGRFQYIGSRKFSLLSKLPLDGQAVFFCKYLFEVDMLIRCLGAERCARYTGLNAGSRDKEKQMFLAGRKQYFVATAGSGGSGSDLTVANKLVFFSKPFRNLATRCISSIDRPGQTKEMYIYDMKTNTGIDRLIDKSVCRKVHLEQEIKTLLADKTRLRQYAEAL